MANFGAFYGCDKRNKHDRQYHKNIFIGINNDYQNTFVHSGNIIRACNDHYNATFL